jgi:hypothetical protein
MEFRRIFWDPESKLEQSQIGDAPYYEVELNSNGELGRVRRFDPSSGLTGRLDFSYSLADSARVTEQKTFDGNGTFTGRKVVYFTPPDHVVTETYDQNDRLLDMIEGAFRYIIRDGKVIIK